MNRARSRAGVAARFIAAAALGLTGLAVATAPVADFVMTGDEIAAQRQSFRDFAAQLAEARITASALGPFPNAIFNGIDRAFDEATQP